ncbi:hypothetical protein HRbin36_01409 [bacterium HR36]|nr:hypothetical protein HRbin36_01409 [bacterium HR36]
MWAKQGIFRPADRRLHAFHAEAHVVQVGLFEYLAQHLLAVVLVVDGELPIEAKPVGVLAQDTGGETVEGADPDAGLWQQLLDAALHLAGGFVGESDGKYLPGFYAAG